MKKELYNEKSTYKIVYKDEGRTKTAKGSIVFYDNNFTSIMFDDGFTLSINNNVIISVAEVSK